MTNPIAVVTGASRGIGYAVAEALYIVGYEVYLVARSYDNLLAAQNRLKKTSGTAEINLVAVDLADIEQVQDFAQQIQSLSVSVLCNAAGILIPGTTTADFSDTKRVIETNLMGTIYLTNLLSENMKHYNKGYIFTVASTQGITATHEIGIYGATKAVLISLWV